MSLTIKQVKKLFRSMQQELQRVTEERDQLREELKEVNEWFAELASGQETIDTTNESTQTDGSQVSTGYSDVETQTELEKSTLITRIKPKVLLKAETKEASTETETEPIVATLMPREVPTTEGNSLDEIIRMAPEVTTFDKIDHTGIRPVTVEGYRSALSTFNRSVGLSVGEIHLKYYLEHIDQIIDYCIEKTKGNAKPIDNAKTLFGKYSSVVTRSIDWKGHVNPLQAVFQNFHRYVGNRDKPVQPDEVINWEDAREVLREQMDDTSLSRDVRAVSAIYYYGYVLRPGTLWETALGKMVGYPNILDLKTGMWSIRSIVDDKGQIIKGCKTGKEYDFKIDDELRNKLRAILDNRSIGPLCLGDQTSLPNLKGWDHILGNTSNLRKSYERWLEQSDYDQETRAIRRAILDHSYATVVSHYLN